MNCKESILNALKEYGMLKKSSLRSICLKWSFFEFAKALNELEESKQIHYKVTDHSKFSGYVLTAGEEIKN